MTAGEVVAPAGAAAGDALLGRLRLEGGDERIRLLPGKGSKQEGAPPGVVF